jgi:hypothetical protein
MPKCREKVGPASAFLNTFSNILLLYLCLRNRTDLGNGLTLLNAGKETLVQCCVSGMFIPDPNFFHPESEFFLIRIIEFKHFSLKN